MQFKDLPRYGITRNPLNRKIYELLWSPFQTWFDIFNGVIDSMKAGIVVAIVGCAMVMGFMFFLGELTLKVAGGIGIISMAAWLSVSLLVGVIRAFR